MTDGIIKGTGNSRYLRSVPNAMTLYPTHEAMMEALAAGTFPIDLNGVNPAGWEVVGNKLDKSTLLTDTLCTALGLATTATPTQAMDKLRTLTATAQSTADSRPKIEVVSYTGTGLSGADNPCSITFSFAPKLVKFIFGIYTTLGKPYKSPYSPSSDAPLYEMIMSVVPTEYTKYLGFYPPTNNASEKMFGKKSADGRTISWYYNSTTTGYSYYQLNDTGYKFYFYGIG